MAPPRKPLVPRLLSNIVKTNNGCWIWQGSKTKDGYGVMGIGRKQFRVHRVAFDVFKGRGAEGSFVCHSCDTPLCINPDHLFLGTPKDNTQDMIVKGRRTTLSGNDHPNIKITTEQHPKIRELREQHGMTLKMIAQQFGVTFQTISRICLEGNNHGTR